MGSFRESSCALFLLLHPSMKFSFTQKRKKKFLLVELLKAHLSIYIHGQHKPFFFFFHLRFFLSFFSFSTEKELVRNTGFRGIDPWPYSVQKYSFPKLLETRDTGLEHKWLVTRLAESTSNFFYDLFFLWSYFPDGELKILWSVTFKCGSTLYWANIQPMDLKSISHPAHLTIRQTIRTRSSPLVYNVVPMNSNAIELNPAGLESDIWPGPQNPMDL